MGNSFRFSIKPKSNLARGATAILAVLAVMIPFSDSTAQTQMKRQGKNMQTVTLPDASKATFRLANIRRAETTDVIEPDWAADFTNSTDFGKFTVVDANNDGTKWEYGTYQKCAQLGSSYTNGNDDWLFSPAFHVLKGRTYSVSFRLRAVMADGCTIEVKYGSSAAASGMQRTLLSSTQPEYDWTSYTYQINPTADGNIYIGFHGNAEDEDGGWILMDGLSIKKEAIGSGPEAVSDLVVTPAEGGTLSANISFTAPQKDINGQTIANVDSIQVRRDGTRIMSVGTTNAGQEVRLTDSGIPSSGSYRYSVIAYLGGEFGTSADTTAYVGIDTPNQPQHVTLTDNHESVKVSWDDFGNKGIHDGYIDPKKVDVTLYKTMESNYGLFITDSITSSENGATSVAIPMNTDETTDENGVTQALYQVAARAHNDIGQSDYAISGGLVIGPSIALPFKETVRDGDADNRFAWLEGNDQYMNRATSASWRIESTMSSDDDGGSFVWSPYSGIGGIEAVDYTIKAGDEASINMPKVTLKDSYNPELIFDLYSVEGENAKLKVLAMTPDGVSHELSSIDLSTITQTGWTTHQVNLGNFIDERYVIIKFWGVSEEDNTIMGVDNVNIFDQATHNLAVIGIKPPKYITEGKTGKVSVIIKNYGANNEDSYNVVLHADNESVDTIKVSNRSLGVLATDTVSLSLPTKIGSKVDSINVWAEVALNGDEFAEDNNSKVVKVEIRASEYEKVTDLTGSNDGKDHVTLSWSRPAQAGPVNVTETFEDYEPFSTELGDWTLVDGDKGLAMPLYQDISYPGQGTAFAFMAFNPNAMTDYFVVTDENPGIKPHSGEQFAAAFYFDKEDARADNWMISPKLTGEKQTISFYAFNVAFDREVHPETFDVLYSTTDVDTASFKVLGNYEANGTNVFTRGSNWKEITVNIPEGATHFAIHHNTNNYSSFVFGIDDIQFVKAAPGYGDEISAYNIYRDGVLVGTVDGNTYTFTDDANGATHTYNVTAVYKSAEGNINESSFSNDVTIVPTGINAINTDTESSSDIYTIDGRLIKRNATNVDNLKRGVYIINKHKIIKQ